MTMSDLVAALPASTVDEAGLAGEWELVYSDVELFRSSPFFLAIEVMRHPAMGDVAAVARCLPHTVATAPSPIGSCASDHRRLRSTARPASPCWASGSG